MIVITQITDVIKYLADQKAVVFDLDDTLYSEKKYVRSGYHTVAQDILTMIPNVEEKLWRAFEECKPAFDTVLEDSGIYTEELKVMCLRAYRQQSPVIHLYDGVEEMLKKIRDKNIKIGVITDGRPEGQRAKIAALKLEPLVDQIIITDELGGSQYRKPCPLAFKMMKEKLNVQFNAMSYIGDNIKKDCQGAVQLGMTFILFNNRDGIYK